MTSLKFVLMLEQTMGRWRKKLEMWSEEVKTECQKSFSLAGWKVGGFGKRKRRKYNNSDGQEWWVNSYHPLPPNAYYMTERLDKHMAKLYQDKWRFNDNNNDSGKYEKMWHLILSDSNISLATAKNSSRATLRKLTQPFTYSTIFFVFDLSFQAFIGHCFPPANFVNRLFQALISPFPRLGAPVKHLSLWHLWPLSRYEKKGSENPLKKHWFDKANLFGITLPPFKQ